MLLSTRPEIRVLELSSSWLGSLDTLPVAGKAELLGADVLIGGTLNQGEGEIRLNLQLFSSDGELQWSERFSDRLLDHSQLENRVLAGMWPQLPLPVDRLAEVQELVTQCRYPPDPDAISAIASTGYHLANGAAPLGGMQRLTTLISQFQDNGLLHLVRARVYFAGLETVPVPRRPVLQGLAMQDLSRAEQRCSELPEVGLLRLQNTLQLQSGDEDYKQYLARFPSESGVRRAIAQGEAAADDPGLTRLLAREAYLLDPLNPDSYCFYRDILLKDPSGSAEKLLDELVNSKRSLAFDFADNCH
jgi:hypothetical protein